MTNQRIRFLLMILVIVLSACNLSTEVGQANLDGTEWVLTMIFQTPPIAGTQPTLAFEGVQVSGNASCNQYGGSFEVRGNSIDFGDLFQTEMYCEDPAGVMDQERTYLELLGSANGFEITNKVLTLFSGQEVVLVFEEAGTTSAAANPPLSEEPDTVQHSPTTETADEGSSPAVSPPAGLREYQDPQAGVSVLIPDAWVVTGIVEGQYAILQSYPEDKYIGGGSFLPGDTKCDLNLSPSAASAADLIEQWKSDPMATILSEEEVVLASGATGRRVEVDSLGQFVALVTEVNERVIVLTCFGDFSPFDQIATTIHARE